MEAREPGLENDQRLFGLDDALFEQRRPLSGLITKREVRAVSLACLGLNQRSVVWDIGSGSGALAIEAARICSFGQVWAVEKNAEDADICRRNFVRSGCANLRLVEGTAPEACQDWPRPNAVFAGGSGGQLAAILESGGAALQSGGRIVANMATFENLQECLAVLNRIDFPVEVTLVQISRSRELQGLTRLTALNPVFVVTGRKPD